ncbi:uncharacterized protein LOC110035990 [Phalaenopsis equestris]|uniref:uncharacterized protein LOC110035990 n=1 Tax=Phalaenopsis equestris TaxID=78828 RepID=UPI0009E47574|nr:uncharacterized protein LOC110035990 [Phalaenopsis equestris]
MSLENEGQLSLRSPMGSSAPVSDQKKPRISYTREFFLSLSELDVCKKLPGGFDKSILSDLEDAANTASERQRSFGNLSLQGSRRGDYGSQLLNKPENSNIYTKGISSRWDTRSSGSSDRELDLQSDRESFAKASKKNITGLAVFFSTFFDEIAISMSYNRIMVHMRDHYTICEVERGAAFVNHCSIRGFSVVITGEIGSGSIERPETISEPQLAQLADCGSIELLTCCLRGPE